MSSANFDTYLFLLAPNGSVLQSDDDSGGGTDSYIPSGGGFYSLPSTGTYTIRGKSFYANQTGSYSVSLIPNSGSGICSGTLVSLGQTINDSLSSTDCYFTSGSRMNSYADVYRFNGFAGQQIAITMSSSAFDTYL